MAAPMFPNKAAADKYWSTHQRPGSKSPTLTPQQLRSRVRSLFFPGTDPLTGLTPAQQSKIAKGIKGAPPGGTKAAKAAASLIPPGFDPNGYTWDPMTGLPSAPNLTAPPGSTVTDPSLGVQPQSFPDFRATAPTRIDPAAYANMVGAKSFAPLIAAGVLQRQQLEGGKAQAHSFLDQGAAATQAQANTGAARDVAASQTANQGLTDLAARLVAATGGDPLAGAAVGRSTANAQTTGSDLSRIAAAGQDDLAAASARDNASQKVAYDTENASRQGALSTQIAGYQHDASTAQGQGLMQALGFNSDQQTQGLARDSARQQANITGRLGAATIEGALLDNAAKRQGTALTADTAALNHWQALSGKQQTDFTNKISAFGTKQQAEQIKAELSKGSKNLAYLALSDPTSDGAQSLQSYVMQGAIGANGPLNNPHQLFGQFITKLKQASPGANPAAIKALAKSYVDSTLNGWQAGHPNATHKWVFKNGQYTLATKGSK